MPAAQPAVAPAAAPSGGLNLVDIRRLWPAVIDRVKGIKRVTWIHLTQNSQVVGFDNGVLALGFQADGPRRSFESGGHADIVQQAIVDEIGATVRIDAIIDPSANPGATPPAAPPPAAPVAPATPAPPSAPPAPPPASDDAPPWAVEPQAGAEPTPRRPRMADIAAQESARAEEPPVDPDAHVDLDDAEVDAESSAELLARELGAQVIEEIPRN